jgi:hypothetical protein
MTKGFHKGQPRLAILKASNELVSPRDTNDLLGTTLSTENYSAAQALFNLGVSVPVLGFALISLTIVSILTRNEWISQ